MRESYPGPACCFLDSFLLKQTTGAGLQLLTNTSLSLPPEVCISHWSILRAYDLQPSGQKAERVKEMSVLDGGTAEGNRGLLVEVDSMKL